MAGDTRSRMLRAAVDGLRRRGVAGTSFTDVLAASGAARGAIYHHFPGGKAQLVAEAATGNAAEIRAGLAALPAHHPGAAVAAFLEAIRPVLADGARGAGCAVAAVALAPDDDPGLRELAGHAFTTWTAALSGRLARAGLPPDQAQELATTLIALLEGAHILCRAAGSLQPFDQMTRAVTALVASGYGLAGDLAVGPPPRGPEPAGATQPTR